MAITPRTGSTSNAAASGKKSKARAPQKRTFHFFIKIVDGAGNPIPGAQMKVERIITDARKVIEFMDTPDFNNLGLTRVKHEVHSNPRGEETDGQTSVG